MTWAMARRLVLMLLIVAVAALTQQRGLVFGYGMMCGALALMLFDKWLESKAIARVHHEHSQHLAMIMQEMRSTFTLQHETIETLSKERDHYRRLYLKKVNGG
jgi:hypothetical protein